MTRLFSCLVGAAVLATIASPPAAAQEYSNGGAGEAGRKAATLTPVEAFGVHPPGIDPADAQRRCARSRQAYVPYYAPLSPVASTARWKPGAYRPLAPYYTPYYPGYSPQRHSKAPPRRYGSNGWGCGPMPEAPLPEEPGTTPLDFGAYTSVIEDDTTYWNMGGNGLVPYGAPQPAGMRSPDLIDAIEAGRPRGRIYFRGAAPAGTPAMVSPGEAADEEKQGAVHGPGRSSRRTQPEEAIPPGEASQEK